MPEADHPEFWTVNAAAATTNCVSVCRHGELGEARRAVGDGVRVVVLPRLLRRAAGRDGRQPHLQGAQGEPGERAPHGGVRAHGQRRECFLSAFCSEIPKCQSTFVARDGTILAERLCTAE